MGVKLILDSDGHPDQNSSEGKMDWKISWWICVVLFSLFLFTDGGSAAFGVQDDGTLQGRQAVSGELDNGICLPLR